jgi:DNA-damage-inducible protein D
MQEPNDSDRVSLIDPLDRLWLDLINALRSGHALLAMMLESRFTMRVDEEYREIVIAGPVDVHNALGADERQVEAINAVCASLGWERYVPERLDIEAGIRPSAYAFMVSSYMKDWEEVDDFTGQPAASSPFDSIKIHHSDGSERWSSRDLAEMLGYARHDNFKGPIERARKALKANGEDPLHHMLQVQHMIPAGKGAKRRATSYYLTRFACYLVSLNSDPSLEMVGQAQGYFALQTRRQELAVESRRDLRRVRMRDEMIEHNKRLAKAARDAGVLTEREMAIFQNFGTMGLYGGLTIPQLRQRRGLGAKDTPLDYMTFDELAPNAFRASLTEQRLRAEGTQGPDRANDVHYESGLLVRETIIKAGATLPEDMPIAEHISAARKRTKGLSLPDSDLFSPPSPDQIL